MEVEISDLQSTVRAVDGDALISPSTMETIVRIVLQAVDDREAHRRRVYREQRVSYGHRHELEEME